MLFLATYLRRKSAVAASEYYQYLQGGRLQTRSSFQERTLPFDRGWHGRPAVKYIEEAMRGGPRFASPVDHRFDFLKKDESDLGNRMWESMPLRQHTCGALPSRRVTPRPSRGTGQSEVGGGGGGGVNVGGREQI